MMRLELKEIGKTAPTHWTFERGRRSLGSAPTCDWRIMESTAAISKLHCTFERDRDGFVLHGESANGTWVDATRISEGERVRLRDGSRLELGGKSFAITIFGDPDHVMETPKDNRHLSDESVTVSTILSDIAPGGSSANGVLGGRQVEDWPERNPGKDATTPSRNVDIGWDGPPAPESGMSLLPEDWNEDIESDYGSQLEHGLATHVRIPVSPARSASSSERPPDQDSPSAAPAPQTPEQEVDLIQVENLIGEIEQAMGELFAIFELESDYHEPKETMGSVYASIQTRLQTLLLQQTRFTAALDGLLSELAQTLEPQSLEARVNSQPRRFPLRLDGRYWNAYRNLFQSEGKDLAFRDLVATRMAQNLPPFAAGTTDIKKVNKKG